MAASKNGRGPKYVNGNKTHTNSSRMTNIWECFANYTYLHIFYISTENKHTLKEDMRSKTVMILSKKSKILATIKT